MEDLPETTLKTILEHMMEDERFVRWWLEMMDSLFNTTKDEYELNETLENLGYRIQERFMGRPNLFEIVAKFKSEFMSMLKEKQFFGFSRILRAMQDNFLFSNERMISYLRKLKFRLTLNEDVASRWVDLRDTSRAIIEALNPTRITSFAQLSQAQRSQLRSFTRPQFDIVSHFRLNMIDTLSRLVTLPEPERRFILHLTEEESVMFNDSNVHLVTSLSSLTSNERDAFLGLSNQDRNPSGTSRFFEMHHLHETDDLRTLLDGILDLTHDQYNILRQLFDQQPMELINLSEQARYVAGRIYDLSPEERDYYMNLDSTEFRALHDLTPDQRNLIEELHNQGPPQNEIFDVANSLTSAQMDIIFSLNDEQIAMITRSRAEIELDLLPTLSQYESDLLCSFLFWDQKENAIFTLLSMELNGSPQDRTNQIRDYFTNTVLNMDLPFEHGDGFFKLFANTVEHMRLSGAMNDQDVAEVITKIEGNFGPSLSTVFKIQLLNVSMRDSSSLEELLMPQMQGNELTNFNVVETTEDVMFMRWILIHLDMRVLFDFAEVSFSTSSEQASDENLKFIFSNKMTELDGIQRDDVTQGFRRLLVENGNSLMTSLLLGTTELPVLSPLIADLLTSSETLQFLQTPFTNEFLEMIQWINHRGVGNILTDPRFPNPNIFDALLYYDRRVLKNLLSKVHERHLWNFINRERPSPVFLLEFMLNRSRDDLLALLEDVEDVNQLILDNREKFMNVIEYYVLDSPNASELDIYRRIYIIRHLSKVAGFMETQKYLDITRRFVRNVPMNTIHQVAHVIDNFIRTDVSRETLYQVIQQDYGVEFITQLRNLRERGCRLRRTKRQVNMICVDSEMAEELRSTEVLELSKTITETAENIGLGFTVFLVGKHLMHLNLEGLGVDWANLWLLPKFGQWLTKVMIKQSEIRGLPTLARLAPFIGKLAGTAGAMVGLGMSIEDRINAKTDVQRTFADINVAANTIFLTASFHTFFVKPILSAFGIEEYAFLEFSNPLASAISVGVIITSYVIQVGLRVQEFNKHITLTWEEIEDLFERFFFDISAPEYLLSDITAKDVYAQYFHEHLKNFKGHYDKIAISIPRIFEIEKNCVDNPDAGPINQTDFCIICKLGEKNTSYIMDSHQRAEAYDLFTSNPINRHSRLLKDDEGGYNITCGPTADNVLERTMEPKIVGSCGAYHDTRWTVQTKELFLPRRLDDNCANIVTFEKANHSNSTRTLFYMTQDATIALSNTRLMDFIFFGQSITVNENPNDPKSEHNYYFQNYLKDCEINTSGRNYFHLRENTLNCKLSGKNNTVVVDRNFTDSEMIHTVIGSKQRQIINVTFADFVDGNGGSDFIYTNERTLVKGYFMDSIVGNGLVLLPMTVNDIDHVIKIDMMTVFSKTKDYIHVSSDTLLLTNDHYFLAPIKTSNVTWRMTSAQLRKITNDRIILDQELDYMRQLKIDNCTLIKQLSSHNYDVILSDMSSTVFVMDYKYNHGYYWESMGPDPNTYVFEKSFAEVTISKGNGILNFQQLFKEFDTEYFTFNLDNSVLITVGGLQVLLLPNYQTVTTTFDGKEYYKIQDKTVVRDWCSHSLPVGYRLAVEADQIRDYLNCFEFRSGMVTFFKLLDNLVIASDTEFLTIFKYYSIFRQREKLSLKLNGEIMNSTIFKDKADHPHRMIGYKLADSTLQIFHNQPDDKLHVGLLNLTDKSVEDFRPAFNDNNLLLLFRNKSMVEIENWKDHEPSRRIMFAFKDRFISNIKCIVAHCDPNDIFEGFPKVRSRDKRSVTNDAPCQSSWINNLFNTFIKPLQLSQSKRTINNHIEFGFSIMNNINLALVLVQNFLDRKYPLPRNPETSSMDSLVDVIGMTEEYERVLNSTARHYDLELRNFNSFQLYTDLMEVVKRENLHDIPKVLYTAAENIYPWHEEFFMDLKINIKKMFSNVAR